MRRAISRTLHSVCMWGRRLVRDDEGSIVTVLVAVPVLAGTVAIGIGSVITGRLITRTGRTMLFPSVGLVFATLFLLVFAFFGRYMASKFTQPPGYEGGSDNLLKTDTPGAEDMVHSTTFGETTVFSASVVNSLRFAVNKATVDNFQNPFFTLKDMGINVYSYDPGYMVLNITGGFQLYPADQARAYFDNDTYQLGEDLTVVRGEHQFGFGVNTQYWRGNYTSTGRTNGSWIINGSATGLGLADFLVGRVTSLEHGGKNRVLVNNWYLGMYAQDAWRASPRLTINYGMRWEPYFGQTVENKAVTIFKMENFQKGIKSTVFHNAPAGLVYPGDPGFPDGQTGLHKQWWNLSPRAGVA